MKKKDFKPLLWLILIPVQLAAGYLFMRIGAYIDLLLFTDIKGNGHGIPFFSAIFLIVSSVFTAIIVSASLLLTIKGFKDKKAVENNEKE